MTLAPRALLGALALAAAGISAACDEPTRPDTTAPRVVIRSPAPDTVVSSEGLSLTVVLTDDERVASATVQVGDGAEQPISITPGDSLELTTVVQLAPGDNRVLVHAVDRAGNRGSAELRVARDAAGPTVRITSPGRDTLVTTRTVTIRGTLADDAGVVSASYSVGTGPQQPISITPGKQVTFEVPVQLTGGESIVQVVARDRVGNTQTASVKITPVARFAAISAGEATTCALDAAGAAFCWGFRYDAQIPAAVSGGHGFAALSNGGSHACGVTAEGAAYCWGFNAQGQLGNGRTEVTSTARTPVRVSGDQRFRAVSAGVMHTCALTDTGAAYCWGTNGSGQLGNGTTTDSNLPVPVAGGRSFRAISAGTSHTCALDTAGAAFCWGVAGGELGLGTASPPPTPTPAPVVGGLTFESIDVGLRTSCAVTAGNQGYCWNSNSGGRPELVAGTSSFRSIGMGGLHSCGVAPGGDAYCWGANRNGEIGDGTRQDAALPTRVAGGITFRVAEAGNSSSVNSGHSCGLATDGIAYCWGYNGSYALGNPSVSLSVVPIPVVAP